MSGPPHGGNYKRAPAPRPPPYQNSNNSLHMMPWQNPNPQQGAHPSSYSSSVVSSGAASPAAKLQRQGQDAQSMQGMLPPGTYAHPPPPGQQYNQYTQQSFQPQYDQRYQQQYDQQYPAPPWGGGGASAINQGPPLHEPSSGGHNGNLSPRALSSSFSKDQQLDHLANVHDRQFHPEAAPKPIGPPAGDKQQGQFVQEMPVLPTIDRTTDDIKYLLLSCPGNKIDFELDQLYGVIDAALTLEDKGSKSIVIAGHSQGPFTCNGPAACMDALLNLEEITVYTAAGDECDFLVCESDIKGRNLRPRDKPVRVTDETRALQKLRTRVVFAQLPEEYCRWLVPEESNYIKETLSFSLGKCFTAIGTSGAQLESIAVIEMQTKGGHPLAKFMCFVRFTTAPAVEVEKSFLWPKYIPVGGASKPIKMFLPKAYTSKFDLTRCCLRPLGTCRLNEHGYCNVYDPFKQETPSDRKRQKKEEAEKVRLEIEMTRAAKAGEKVCKMMLKGKCVWGFPPFNASGKSCPNKHLSPEEVSKILCCSALDKIDKTQPCRFTASQCPYMNHFESVLDTTPDAVDDQGNPIGDDGM